VNLVYGSCRRTKVDHLLIRLRRRRFFSKKDCSILGGFDGCRVTIDDRSVTFWCSEFCKVQLLNHFYLIRELKCGDLSRRIHHFSWESRLRFPHKNNSHISSTSSKYGRGEMFYRNASRCCDFLFVTLLLVSDKNKSFL
jgi:hypothetical protein